MNIKQLLSLCLLTVGLVIASSTKDASKLSVFETKAKFVQSYGNDWQFRWNENNTPHRIIGGGISYDFDARDASLTEEIARQFIDDNSYLFQLSSSNFDLWVNDKKGNIRYLIFNQMVNDIPVHNGRVDFRYTLDGKLVLIGHDAYPEVKVNISPSLSSEEAIAIAKSDVGFNENNEDYVIDEPKKFIWIEKGEEPKFHLSWVVQLFVNLDYSEEYEIPVRNVKVFVDAHDGEVLYYEELAASAVSGYVTGMVKDEPFGPEYNRGFQYARVFLPGGTVTYTDVDGYYSANISSSGTATVTLQGTYLYPQNANGGEASTSASVSQNSTQDFHFDNSNSIPGERDTYYHGNLVHDLLKEIHPEETGADYSMTANVNIGSEDSYWPCNAYWDGSSINMFSEGGGCAATDQMADVVYHEYGHGIQQFVYDPYSPPSNSGMGEGCSDYWSMTIINSPCLGNGFFGEGTCLRDGNNDRQYPGNDCGGSVHCLGEITMGSLWLMRGNLINYLGYEAAVPHSDSLFVYAQVARPTTVPDFLDEILIVDDDDGNVNNGTPNYQAICEGFEAHNVECPFSGPIASLEYDPASYDISLGVNETTTETLTLFNTGQSGSVLAYNIGTSPFENIGGGPDGEGNFWTDSDTDSSIPSNWIDISSVGTQLSFSTNDIAADPINIGFSFPFYEDAYSQCIVNPNGWVGFGSDNTGWENSNIPSSSAPSPAVFGFWDDLNPVNDNCNEYCSGNVYYHSTSERLVVWFNQVAHWWTNFENSYYDFQIVLYPSGEVHLNYSEITGNHTATIGMQNITGTDGLQVSFTSNDYVHGDLSIRFAKGATWLSASPSSGTIDAGASQDVIMSFSSEGLAGGNHSTNVVISSNGGNGFIPVTMTIEEDQSSFDAAHNGGWNMVGLPLEVSNSDYDALYPDAVDGTLYAFDGIYQSVESLSIGSGYWLRFWDAGSNTITGSSIESLTLSLNEGWNLISGISNVVNESDIYDPNGIIIPGSFYTFNGVYLNTTSIDPGNGYWVRASSSGEITLSTGAGRTVVSNAIADLGDVPFLTFTNSEEYSGKLYYGSELSEEEKLSFSLPPVPPSGAFDVRFSEGSKYTSENAGEILIQNHQWPLKIEIFNLQSLIFNEAEWVLVDETSGKEYILSDGGTVKITEPTNRLTLYRNTLTPEPFALHQNYPNPFNPTTTIHYDLPEDSDVKLVVFDLLGRRVTELVTGRVVAGSHSEDWDASEVSSGVYIYQLTTHQKQITKKMILLK